MKVDAAIVPKSMALTPVKFVPVIVTDVPPPWGPKVGLMYVTVGGNERKRKRVKLWAVLVP